MTKWVGGLGEVTAMTQAPSGGEIGKRFHMIAIDRDENTRTEMEMTVTELVANQRLGVEIRSVGDPSGGFVESEEYRLSGSGGETHLTMEVQTTYHGRVTEALEPFITSAARKKMQRDLERLKKLVETESAQPVSERITNEGLLELARSGMLFAVINAV